MLSMDGEQKTNKRKSQQSVAMEGMSPQEQLDYLEQLRRELESEQAAPELVPVDMTDEEMEALSDEQLRAHIELYEERVELGERHEELDQRALKLGLLKLANEAPRCNHLKSNGKPCRAPALGNRLFCVFHGRALETQDSPRIKVAVLEDRQSLQITVKQIMEQIVSGGIEPQNASLLLRAVQIANSTLKSGRVRAARKSARGEPASPWGNAEENAG